jgi:hypothetical protein
MNGASQHRTGRGGGQRLSERAGLGTVLGVVRIVSVASVVSVAVCC